MGVLDEYVSNANKIYIFQNKKNDSLMLNLFRPEGK